MNHFYLKRSMSLRLLLSGTVAGIVLLTTLVPGGPAGAADDQALFKDLRHTLLVREALQNDKRLAPLNLGVKVDDRVAVLWGTAPSELLQKRAVHIAWSLPDIRAVRSQLLIEDTVRDEPLVLPPVSRPFGVPEVPISPPALKPKKATVPITSKKVSQTPAYRSPWQLPEDERRRTAAKSAHAKALSKVDKSSIGFAENFRVGLPAIIVPFMNPPATIVKRSPDVSSLEKQVAALIRNNPRYRHLRFQVDGQSVHLSGAARRGRDAHDLARAVAELYGVESVVIGRVVVLSQSR